MPQRIINPHLFIRLCLEKVFPHWFLYSRAFSGAEAVNALRPFYFAVHPDFFGQHPRERVNILSFLTVSLHFCLVYLPVIQDNREFSKFALFCGNAIISALN